MRVVLGFLPFLVFAVLSLARGATVALIAGALVSAFLIVRGVRSGAAPKILEVGTLVLFAALAAYSTTAEQRPSIVAVRLCVDAGLLAIVLISIALRRPFTLQYAREQVPEAYWNTPRFIRTNYLISGAWAAAFAVMVVAESAMLLSHLPTGVGTVVIAAALIGAAYFTKWRSSVARTAAQS